MPLDHRPKHPINHANMEVHMAVQAGAEAVDECNCPNVQGRLVHTQSPWAVGLQAYALIGMSWAA